MNSVLRNSPDGSWHWTILLLLATCSAPMSAQATEPLSFNRDIRPILSEKCFQCHGPDSVSREADLRLDTAAGLSSVTTAKGADTAELLRRINHQDPGQLMPPPDSGRELTPAEIERLQLWIEQGASWQQHWAFLPPIRPAPPQVSGTAQVQNPIDQFVIARLSETGLQPAAPADKATLIRRVTFDLTGLPPTPSEVDAFLQDNSAQAWQRVVDRLLASPHYGERMATIWLDAARYADSHGYSLDRRRVMWPWRDWVISAFNQNLPFDQFTVEQIAGDLLPDATIAQQVATGFNRNHPIQSEGGVINEEYRVETVVDRVETTAAVFLGLTLGCARCHDHKYDPISQQDFYQFYALFNNVPETAHVGNRDNDADKPMLQAASVLQQTQIAQLQQLIAAAEADLQQQQTEQFPPVETIWIDDELPQGANAFGNGGGPQEFLFVSSNTAPVFSGKKVSQRESMGRGQHGFEGAQPLTISAGTKLFTWVYLDADNPPQEIMLQFNGPKGWEHRAWWGKNLIEWGTDGSSSRLSMGPLPDTGKWVRLEVDAAAVGLTPGSQLTGWAFTQFDGRVYWDRSGIVSTPVSPAAARLNELRAELETLQQELPTVMVMAELSPRRPTYILTRGQYDQPSSTEVQPQLPEVLGVLAPSHPDRQHADRLSLARWLVSEQNPLTARVTVNRLWQLCFGAGLVATPEDFGSQGALPTHPELLDWLATEFVRSSWDTKAMLRLLLTSATYQQSSVITQQHLEMDPRNQLLSRAARFRLPAEMLRDNALVVSGLLESRLGGPSVYPYQPPGLWDDVVYGNVPGFQQDHGWKLYRRSLYTYWKRSVPPPNLQILDAPSREACVLQRSRTNTPLTSLVLMNDPTFVEAARCLAERALREVAGDDEQRLRWLVRITTSRTPTDQELPLLLAALQQSRERYQADPQAAERLMTVGEYPWDQQLDCTEIAAFGSVCSALLNTDEVISRN